MKKCTKCGVVKELSEFNKNKASSDGYTCYCRNCTKEYYQEWSTKNKKEVLNYQQDYYQKNKERYRNNNYLRDFGITLEQYNNQLKIQDHKCAICGGTDETKALAVDHCHSTGEVRGLLCWRCNGTLGKFKDSIELLQNAIKYLQNPPFKG